MTQHTVRQPFAVLQAFNGKFLLGIFFLACLALGSIAWRRFPLLPSAQTAAATLRSTPAGHPLVPFDGGVRQCDVLVVGGSPAGIAAALAAARRGAHVILIEERPHLGGDIVYQMMNMFDVPVRPGQASPVIQGIFAEFFDQLGVAFDIEKARRLFEDTVTVEPTLRVYVRTRARRIIKQGNRVTGVILTAVPGIEPGAGTVEWTVAVRTVVDATNDASFAARAGAGYFLGRENANPDKRMQSAGLLFSVAGVNWGAVRRYVQSTRLITVKATSRLKYAIDLKATHIPAKLAAGTRGKAPGSAPDGMVKVRARMGGIAGNYAWERGNIIKNYKPRGPNILFLSINFGRQSDGTVVLNTLNIVNVNGLSEYSVQKAHQEAVRELPYFMAHLRRTMPGFAKARLAAVAPELYIRETRHIQGFYTLKAEDIVGERRFPDRIAVASYPLDLHPYHKNDRNPYAPARHTYTLPLRCLVPTRVNGVFVASRSLSASYTAAGSARVIPITMAAGEAVGAAAWLCAERNITPHDMVKHPHWLAELQESLRTWGADIGDTYPKALIPTQALAAAKIVRPSPVHKPVLKASKESNAKIVLPANPSINN